MTHNEHTGGRLIGDSEYKVARQLRYGENPRQKYAALFVPSGKSDDPLSLEKYKLVAGSGPSFINMTDIHRLVETATRTLSAWTANLPIMPPLISIAVKHGNVCGASIGLSSVREGRVLTIQKMVEGNRVAISGGAILCNFHIDVECAELLRKHALPGGQGRRVLDIVVAPSFDDDAVNVLARKNGKCRLFANPALGKIGYDGKSYVDCTARYRQVRGGFLMQDGDSYALKIPSEWAGADFTDILLGWSIGSTSHSNTIVLTKNAMFIGAGLCQPSRVLACKVAVMQAREAGHSTEGAVAYSDSFFPFRDSIDVLADVGIKAIFATSGSVRDEEVRAACEERGVKLFQLPDTEIRGFYGH